MVLGAGKVMSGMSICVSETGAEGTWTKVAATPDDHAATRTSQGTSFDLQSQPGRYVRIGIESKGKPVRIGEIRIWGWPLDTNR